jgi:hypothetical protein
MPPLPRETPTSYRFAMTTPSNERLGRGIFGDEGGRADEAGQLSRMTGRLEGLELSGESPLAICGSEFGSGRPLVLDIL